MAQFNLDVDEVQSAARELDPWRRNIAQPLVLEVRAVCSRAPKCAHQEGHGASCLMLATGGRPGLPTFLSNF